MVEKDGKGEREREREREYFLALHQLRFLLTLLLLHVLLNDQSVERCVYIRRKNKKETWWCTNTNIKSFFPTHLMYASYPFLIRILFSQKSTLKNDEMKGNDNDDDDDNSNCRHCKKLLYVEIDSKRKLNINVKLRSFLLSHCEKLKSLSMTCFSPNSHSTLLRNVGKVYRWVKLEIFPRCRK